MNKITIITPGTIIVTKRLIKVRNFEYEISCQPDDLEEVTRTLDLSALRWAVNVLEDAIAREERKE